MDAAPLDSDAAAQRVRADDARKNAAVQVWLMAGFIGAAIGLVSGGSSELIAYARFLSGSTVYPAGNPMAIALAHTATPFHLAVAWLLQAGLSETTSSRIIFALIPMVYLQAFALITFALCERPLLSVLTGVAGVLTLVFLEGADYPLNILHAGTLGVLGLGWLLLVPAFAGVGWFRSAAIAATLLATAHPVYALLAVGLSFLCAITSIALPASGRFELPWRATLAGAAASLALWIVLTLMAPDLPAPPSPDPVYLKAYFDLWDFHRNVPVDARTLVILAQSVATVVLLAALALTPAARIGAAARGMTLFLLIASACGVVAWTLFHALRDVLPYFALIAMPNRMLNVAEIVALPAIVGVVARAQPRWLGGALLTSIAVLAISAYFSLTYGYIAIAGHKWAEHAYATVLAAAAIAMLRGGKAVGTGAGQIAEQALVARTARLTPPLVAPVAAAAALIAIAVWSAPPSYDDRVAAFLQRLNDRQFVIIPQEDHNLDNSIIRNAQLINPSALDILPYVPGLMPDYADALRDIYGVDFFNPPEATRRLGRLMDHTSAALWSRRSLAEWQDLGRRYDVSIIAATPDVVLPMSRASFGDVVLYFIPPATP